MIPVPLFLIIVTLPLLLGGCSIEEPVTETKLELEGVNAEELERRRYITYRKGSDTPYTGKAYSLHANRQKAGEWNYKNGKQDGLFVWWNEKGKKVEEENYIKQKLTHVIEPESNVFHQQYKFNSRVLIDFIVAEKAQRKKIQLPICERWAPNHPN